jgi:5-methylcytosine-specific restriction endonuclease McrA
MKFELNEYHRNMSDAELIEDLKAVAIKLGSNYVSADDYKKYGKYHPSTLTRRFGSWVEVLSSAHLEVKYYHDIPNDELLGDLKKVANILNKNTVTQSEYKSLGKYSPDALKDHFGSWFSALEKASLEKTKNLNITTEELFINLEEVWIKLGRQPSFSEVSKPLSKYSKDVYARRFGSWRKALETFVEYINKDGKALVQSENKQSIEHHSPEIQAIQRKTTRNINLRLRFIVMRRDNFKCQSCGRSPATDPGVILHIDHKKAWANGGETVLDNLQTLCSVCNIGKSNI